MRKEAVHVVPLDDLKKHIESGTYCHCKPRLQDEGSSILVVHNAYDGREFFEDVQETGTQEQGRG